MSDHDPHLEEIARQCATHTQFSRLAGVEQMTVLRWLLDNGHMVRTGQALQRPRQAPRAIATKPDGTPIYDRNADHSTHDTVKMA